MPANLWVIVAAAGQGSRMAAPVAKQYLKLADKTILEHSLEKLLQLAAQQFLLVLDPDDQHFEQLQFKHEKSAQIYRINGGRERCHSVFNALQYLAGRAQADDWVVVHDVARPCVNIADIKRLLSHINSCRDCAGGILAQPVVDTLKRVEDTKIAQTLDRTNLWAAQTPQIFRFEILYKCLERALAQGHKVTDEAQAVELGGFEVRVCQGRASNIKVTTPEDLQLANFYLNQESKC